MPIYEYQCADCSHKLEKLQKMADAPLKDCPACGESTLIKLVSAARFRLKGDGWYETDFKTGKKKNVASSDSSSSDSSGSGSSDSGSSDSGSPAAGSPAAGSTKSGSSDSGSSSSDSKTASSSSSGSKANAATS